MGKLKIIKQRQSKDKGREMESKSGEGEEGDCNDTGPNFKAIRFHFPDETPSLRCHCPAPIVHCVCVQRLYRHLHSVCSACARWVSDMPSLHVNVRSLLSSCFCQFRHWIGQSASQRQEGNYPEKCLCSKSQFTFDMGLHQI